MFKCRLAMAGGVVVGPCFDSPSSHLASQRIARNPKLGGIDRDRKIFLARLRSRRYFHKCDAGQVRKFLAVESSNLIAANHHTIEQRQRSDRRRRTQFRHAAIDAGEQCIVGAVVTILPTQPHKVGQAIAVGRDNTPFSRRQQLRGRQAKDLRGRVAADRFAMHARTEAMGGIDHQRQVVLGSDCLQRRHVTGIAKVVAGGNSNCAGRDGSGNRLRQDVGGGGINFDEHRPQIIPDNCSRTGEKGKAWHDDLPQRLVAIAAAG